MTKPRDPENSADISMNSNMDLERSRSDVVMQDEKDQMINTMASGRGEQLHHQ